MIIYVFDDETAEGRERVEKNKTMIMSEDERGTNV